MTTLTNPTADIRFGTSDTWDPNASDKSLTNGFDQARYAAQDREAPIWNRESVQNNYSLANAALAHGQSALSNDAYVDRNGQEQAVRALASQANGSAPSAANIYAGIGAGNAFQAALQGQAAGHSSLANAAMSRQALMSGGQAQLQNSLAAGQARGQEIGSGSGAFAQAGSQLRGNDYANANAYTGIGQQYNQMATQQGQNNLVQLGLNQKYNEDQENQIYQMGQAQKAGELASLGRFYGNQASARGDDVAAMNQIMQYAGAASSAAGSLGGAYATSGGGAGVGYSPPALTSSTSGVSSGGVMQNQGYSVPSDARAKEAAWDVLPLYEPEGTRLQQTPEGHGYLEQESVGGGGGLPVPSLASSPHAQQAERKLAQAAAQPTKKRVMSYDELMAAANAMEKQQNATFAGSLAQGAAVQPDDGLLADANRKMAGQPYRYKPEFVPPDEVPGQVHHGFMAQNLEQNPVTATAVETGPDGMKRVNHARMIQSIASGLSDLQRQVDETRMHKGGG